MAADPAWVTELSADNPHGGTGNDVLRQAGDGGAIYDKYAAFAGAATWNDAQQGEFIDAANAANLTPNFDWLAGLSDAEANAFRGTHTVDGMVTLTVPGTRTALTNSTGWTAEMTTAITAAYQTQAQRLYETLGLTNVGESGIWEALQEIPDYPGYDQAERKRLLKSIDQKRNGSEWRETTSTANLAVIDGVIGV